MFAANGCRFFVVLYMQQMITIFLAFFLSVPGKCCLNIYGQDIHGGHHVMEHGLFTPGVFSESVLKKNLSELKKKLNSSKYNWQTVSDYGAYMIEAGLYADGLALFRELFKRKPNEYTIIQNLGTAFELNGMPDSALHYIKKGYALNPKSHNASEWLHVIYLEHKVLKHEIDFSKNMFLDTVVINQIINDGGGTRLHFMRLDDFFMQINYQLRERIPFTSGKDDLLAKLLLETGDLYAEKFSAARAHIFYLYARSFTSLPQAKKIIEEKINRVLAAANRHEAPAGQGADTRRSDNEYRYALRRANSPAIKTPMNTEKWGLLTVNELVAKLAENN